MIPPHWAHAVVREKLINKPNRALLYTQRISSIDYNTDQSPPSDLINEFKIEKGTR
ncbi:MAG: hypothetical protein KF860_11915 [Cyclobacteriaceae bacterium]|nr:hypothetical protein [Cyclobacteriaceae bacterium]